MQLDINNLKELLDVDAVKKQIDKINREVSNAKDEILKEIETARQSAQKISKSSGDHDERNLDENNPVILKAELRNLALNMDEDTEKNNPKKFKKMLARVNEIKSILGNQK